MSLREYKKKRIFDKTKEPKPVSASSKAKNLFVIQKHRARSLHYDFRIEVGKSLKSWAVPKGLSKSTRDKRLAVQTEDHPLAYAKFEGKIPKGEYGAGTVQTWDIGKYQNLKNRSLRTCLKEGRVELWLEGKRFCGGYALVRMRDKNWLLIKMNDKKIMERKDARKSKSQKKC